MISPLDSKLTFYKICSYLDNSSLNNLLMINKKSNSRRHDILIKEIFVNNFFYQETVSCLCRRFSPKETSAQKKYTKDEIVEKLFQVMKPCMIKIHKKNLKWREEYNNLIVKNMLRKNATAKNTICANVEWLKEWHEVAAKHEWHEWSTIIGELKTYPDFMFQKHERKETLFNEIKNHIRLSKVERCSILFELYMENRDRDGRRISLSIDCQEGVEHLYEKDEWLRDWILNQASDEDRCDFLKAATGFSSLSPRYIFLKEYWQANTTKFPDEDVVGFTSPFNIHVARFLSDKKKETSKEHFIKILKCKIKEAIPDKDTIPPQFINQLLGSSWRASRDSR